MVYFCGFSFYSLLVIPTLLEEVMFQSQIVILNIVVSLVEFYCLFVLSDWTTV